jgi:ribonuclease HII
MVLMVEEYLIGVDEAGRGPLAGPVAVGVVAVPMGFDVLREFSGVKDSKLLSRQKREAIFIEVERRASRGDLSFSVRFSDHSYIDRFGITRAVERAVASGVRELGSPSHSTVMLDGLLRAPRSYTQRTVIGGDLRVPVIALASILAKVTRDRTMEQLAMFYPEYGFEQHKGYGTLEHRRAIRRHGLCAIHRKTFCASTLSKV